MFCTTLILDENSTGLFFFFFLNFLIVPDAKGFCLVDPFAQKYKTIFSSKIFGIFLSASSIHTNVIERAKLIALLEYISKS